MTNLKVCQILAGDEEGGLENHFVELCNGLSQLGCDVIAIGHPKYQDRVKKDVRYYPIDLTQNRRNPITLFRTLRILTKEQPDIIHAQANKAASILTNVIKISKLFRTPLNGIKIGTIHNRKKSTAMFNYMDAVIGVSKGVVENLSHHNIQVIYNGVHMWDGPVEDKNTVTQKYNLDSSLPLALAVGRLVPTKAFDNLISAWQPSFGNLIIAGDGPEKQYLQNLIDERSLKQNIVLAGNLDNIRAIMPAADLMIFSSHREGFSYALIEALLARLPVISTRVPGAVEILPEENLIATDNIPELKSVVEENIKHLSNLHERMEPIFSWAAQTLVVDTMVSNTLAFYRKQS